MFSWMKAIKNWMLKKSKALWEKEIETNKNIKYFGAGKMARLFLPVIA